MPECVICMVITSVCSRSPFSQKVTKTTVFGIFFDGFWYLFEAKMPPRVDARKVMIFDGILINFGAKIGHFGIPPVPKT